MKKSEQKKIIKQIYRLCEKQYRKGFQHGFYACNEGKMTLEQVDNFRYQGGKENYKKVINPFMNYSEVPSYRIASEMRMPNMDELTYFIDNIEF